MDKKDLNNNWNLIRLNPDVFPISFLLKFIFAFLKFQDYSRPIQFNYIQ